MRFELFLALMLCATACGDDSKPPPRGTSAGKPAIVLVPGDGGVSSTAIATTPGVDPSSVHLDDHGTSRPIERPPVPARERRPIDVTLRSSPPGASVSVDGTPLGPTPTFWSGYADGREHQFVFMLPGHALARYRFVPVSSGVIHARLEPIAVERDAGVAPPPEVVPGPAPSAVVPPAPPPTIVTPAVDAAVPAPQPVPAPVPAPTPAPAGSGSAAAPAPVVPGMGPQP